MSKAQIKLLSAKAKVPTKGSEYAAGYDLYAAEDAIIIPGTCIKVSTDVAITPPAGYFGAIFARSGLSVKQGLRPANCVGVADYDYTGPYIVALYNDSNESRYVSVGDRIAQLVFIPYADIEFEEVDELAPTERADGGFGHSGIN